MGAIEKAVKVSSKGQITLPKRVRELLQTDLVRIVVEGGVVRIEPLRDVAGNLKPYASKYVSLKRARDKAWTGALREKHVRD
jgi:AbrB family looped-hinge helix DNA binding protein